MSFSIGSIRFDIFARATRESKEADRATEGGISMRPAGLPRAREGVPPARRNPTKVKQSSSPAPRVRSSVGTTPVPLPIARADDVELLRRRLNEVRTRLALHDGATDAQARKLREEADRTIGLAAEWLKSPAGVVTAARFKAAQDTLPVAIECIEVLETLASRERLVSAVDNQVSQLQNSWDAIRESVVDAASFDLDPKLDQVRAAIGELRQAHERCNEPHAGVEQRKAFDEHLSKVCAAIVDFSSAMGAWTGSEESSAPAYPPRCRNGWPRYRRADVRTRSRPGSPPAARFPMIRRVRSGRGQHPSSISNRMSSPRSSGRRCLLRSPGSLGGSRLVHAGFAPRLRCRIPGLRPRIMAMRCAAGEEPRRRRELRGSSSTWMSFRISCPR